MKSALTIILFILLNGCNSCWAQDSTDFITIVPFDESESSSIFLIDSLMTTTYAYTQDSDHSVSMLIEKEDTSIEVIGDSMTAIKNLFKAWGDSMRESNRLKDLLDEAGHLLYQKYYGIEVIEPKKKKT